MMRFVIGLIYKMWCTVTYRNQPRRARTASVEYGLHVMQNRTEPLDQV